MASSEGSFAQDNHVATRVRGARAWTLIETRTPRSLLLEVPVDPDTSAIGYALGSAPDLTVGHLNPLGDSQGTLEWDFEEGRVEHRHTGGAVDGGVDVAVASVHERRACRIRPTDAIARFNVNQLTLGDVDDDWARVGVPWELRAGLDCDPGDHRPGRVVHIDHGSAVFSCELDPELPLDLVGKHAARCQ